MLEKKKKDFFEMAFSTPPCNHIISIEIPWAKEFSL